GIHPCLGPGNSPLYAIDEKYFSAHLCIAHCRYSTL
ncbi:MAG: hypothetical protein AVDCRST_MAG95-977, partial [uncultured Adhaeribacter sp.]